jgi:ribonuclease Z
MTVPGPDSELALFVAFEHVRFLFGCGEGTQRAMAQRRVSWRGLQGIFVGGGASAQRSGLAGMSVHLADVAIH